MKRIRLTAVLAAMLAVIPPCMGSGNEYVTDNPIECGLFMYEIVDWNGEPEARLMEVAPGKAAEMVDVEVPAELEYEGVKYPVRYLEPNVFYQLEELRTVFLPSSLEHIYGNFVECPKLEKVVFQDGMNAYCGFLFSDCPSLTAIEFPSTMFYFGDHFLASCGLKSLVCDRPFGVGSHSICAMPNLEELVFNASAGFFEGCCRGLSKLKRIDLTRTEINEIYAGMFSLCEALEEVCLPANEELMVAADAFTFCPSLKRVYCPNVTPPWVRKGMAYEPGDPLEFGGATGTEGSVDKENCILYVPVGAAGAYRANAQWSAFRNIVEYDFASARAIGRDLDGAVEGPAEYYDLGGRRVEAPARGIYIVRQGDRAGTAIFR